MSKEYSELNEIIKEAKEYISFEKNKDDLEKIINDTQSENDIKNLAELELKDLIRASRLFTPLSIYMFIFLYSFLNNNASSKVATKKCLHFCLYNARHITSLPRP